MSELEKVAGLLVENWLADTKTEASGAAITTLKQRVAKALDDAFETGLSRAMAPTKSPVVITEYLDGSKAAMAGPGGSGSAGSSEGQVVS